MKKKRRMMLCGIMILIMALAMAMPVSVSAEVDDNDVARIGDQGYDTLSAAVASVAEGGEAEITLLKTVTGASTVRISEGKDITIDLNGNDIGFSENQRFNVIGGKLTLTGTGTVREESPYYAPVMMAGSAEDVADYSVVNVGEGVTLTGWAGLFINQNNGSDYGIVANVYGTLNSVRDTTGADGHALYINGQIKVTEDNVPKITLEGATLNAEAGTGMYLAGYAETVINDSTITSSAEGGTGIEIRAGKISITDSTVSGGMGEPETDPNGNGVTSINTALSVAQHTTKLPIEVTVTNSSFNGGAAFSQQNPQNNGEEDIEKVSLDLQSGNFNGQVYSENKTDFISSGTFSDPVNADYIKDSMIEISFKSGETTRYHVGNQEQINEIVKDAASGDKIEVIQGDVDLTVPAGGVEISNSGSGTVTVNDEPVTDDIVITEEPEPTTPTDPTEPGNTDPTGNTAAGSGVTATGDDTNLTLMFVIMGLAAAAAAGTVVYGRRKRSS